MWHCEIMTVCVFLKIVYSEMQLNVCVCFLEDKMQCNTVSNSHNFCNVNEVNEQKIVIPWTMKLSIHTSTETWWSFFQSIYYLCFDLFVLVYFWVTPLPPSNSTCFLIFSNDLCISGRSDFCWTQAESLKETYVVSKIIIFAT